MCLRYVNSAARSWARGKQNAAVSEHRLGPRVNANDPIEIAVLINGSMVDGHNFAHNSAVGWMGFQ